MLPWIRRNLPRFAGWAMLLASIGVLVVMTVQPRVVDDDPDLAAAPKTEVAPEVAVVELKPETIEITRRYTGMFHPWERYELSFEMAGRVVGFNELDGATQLDEGMRVRKGQVVARLDDQLYVAAVQEAQAELDRAKSEKRRADDLKSRNERAISENEHQTFVTNLALAEARLSRAETNLRNTRLLAPADGVIAKRSGVPGVTTAPHVVLMEILEVHDLLLMVDVPESQVSKIQPGQLVHIELVGQDLFQRPLNRLHGQVYRIAESSDRGVFRVEIKTPNPAPSGAVDPADSNSAGSLQASSLQHSALRPGLIAHAHIVLRTLDGFRAPIDSGVNRDGGFGLFAVIDEPKGPKAELVRLEEWVEQGPWLVLPQLAPEHRRIVVRGQHRLDKDMRVTIVEDPQPHHLYSPPVSVTAAAR